MANEVRSEDRPADAATLLKDHRLMNAVVRLVTAAAGVGCLGFAGYYATSSPGPGTFIVAGFLVTGLILLVLALASDPTSTPPS